jgi:hypothetical protein
MWPRGSIIKYDLDPATSGEDGRGMPFSWGSSANGGSVAVTWLQKCDTYSAAGAARLGLAVGRGSALGAAGSVHRDCCCWVK